VTTNLYAPPKAHLADILQHEAAPALWNPGAAASWSVLFSPVFGAFLHMKNWQALGESEKAAGAKKWIAIYIVTIVGFALAGAFLPNDTAIPAILRLCGFGLLLAWYYASGKPQVDFVKARYGKDYPRKGWAQPLIIALGVVIGFVFLIGALVGVLAVVLWRS